MAGMTMEESIYHDADEIGRKCQALREAIADRPSEVAGLIDQIQDHSCEIQTALERGEG